MNINDVQRMGVANTFMRVFYSFGCKSSKRKDVCTRSISLAMQQRKLKRVKFYYKFYSREYTTQHVRWIRSVWRALGVPEHVVKRVTVKALNTNGINFYKDDDATFILLLHSTIRDINEFPRTAWLRYTYWKMGMDVLDAYNLGSITQVKIDRNRSASVEYVQDFARLMDQAGVNDVKLAKREWSKETPLRKATTIRGLQSKYGRLHLEGVDMPADSRIVVRHMEKYVHLFKGWGENTPEGHNIRSQWMEAMT